MISFALLSTCIISDLPSLRRALVQLVLEVPCVLSLDGLPLSHVFVINLKGMAPNGAFSRGSAEVWSVVNTVMFCVTVHCFRLNFILRVAAKLLHHFVKS